MRLERRSGNTGRTLEVEQAHEKLFGSFKKYSDIAAELYDKHGTSARVHAEIRRLYEVDICKKTASSWVNRGMDERRQRQLATSGGGRR